MIPFIVRLRSNKKDALTGFAPVNLALGEKHVSGTFQNVKYNSKNYILAERSVEV